MELTLIILGFVFSLFSFLPYLKVPWWWVRVLDFPRLHVAVLLAAILLFYSVRYATWSLPQMAMMGLWLAAILNEVWFIYSFTPMARIEALRSEKAKPASAFTMMIANVRMVNKKYREFTNLVLREDPDILVMNEPDEAWHQNVRHVLDERYPYSIKKPLDNTYGMMLYSRLKLTESEINFLVEDDIPSFHTLVELPGGKKIELYTLHPQPPRLLKDTETREAELLLVAKMVKKSKQPSIVAGDLNDVAWSRTTKLFRQISGLLDPRVGRGFYNTYNAHIPLFRYPLDHVFYDPAFRLLDLRRLDKFGSDHFPISISLNYEPEREDKQDIPVAEPEDHKEANELIQEGLEKGEERNNKK
ncbi:endonuclease/exonuclease/phosphatase family protein [Pontibacter sp. Tf4]|uniref:endonuclease/exonuclease/phosphatase family protein n=1 Tax=Pontibacter sp. Tf4 TaxID=2761620 RepID=UPI0016279519|nr:endonuclease/exonuclease/phosphatase family protein [Pontibacter sp. Tf4]MBB6611241.1 endonuclease/exonuclease/phosphatase family protein [Pontibacter sp. Tf4]